MLEGVVIRKAISSDMNAVFDLIMELAVYEHAPNEVTNSVDQLIQDGFGNTPHFECLVATADERVIGFALSYISYSTWKGKCLYLEDFLVTEEYRRKGVGKLLFDRMYEIAVQGGFKRFHWQVLDWNTPALSFYKKYEAELDSTWVNCRLVLTP